MPPTREDYKKAEYIEKYARSILNNLDSIKEIEERGMLSTYWDVLIGQIRVTSIWPSEGEIHAIDLETKLGYFKKDKIQDTIYKLFENKGHKIDKINTDINVSFDFLPDKTGKTEGQFETNITFTPINDILSIHTWWQPIYALRYLLEFSDALGLKTRPFSKTPRPFKIKEIS